MYVTGGPIYWLLPGVINTVGITNIRVEHVGAPTNVIVYMVLMLRMIRMSRKWDLQKVNNQSAGAHPLCRK